MNNTIYDDVFRTMAQKFPYLFIALINEVFGTSFPEDVKIETHRNEFITKRGKIITDSIFLIERRLFHIECQSNKDHAMAIRMFEYDFAIAIEDAIHQGKPYEVTLPDSCVVYIRANRNTPNELKVRVRIGDVEVPYFTRVIKVASYTLDDLISKKLKVLLPYYMVRYEKALPQDYVANCAELLESTKSILSPSEMDLISLILQIAEKVAPNKDARKEVSDMGGKVLELWSEKKIAEGALQTTFLYVSKGRVPIEEAAEDQKMTLEEFKEAMIKAGYQIPE